MNKSGELNTSEQDLPLELYIKRQNIKLVQIQGFADDTSLVRTPAWPINFLRSEDSHCDRTHCCPSFGQWLCGKVVNGFERIL